MSELEATPKHLLKECECIVHEGPHWLYVDRCWREANYRLLAKGNVRGWLVEEKARLEWMLRMIDYFGLSDADSLGEWGAEPPLPDGIEEIVADFLERERRTAYPRLMAAAAKLE